MRWWVVLCVLLASCAPRKTATEPSSHCVQIEEEFYEYVQKNYQASRDVDAMHKQVKACLEGRPPDTPPFIGPMPKAVD